MSLEKLDTVFLLTLVREAHISIEMNFIRSVAIGLLSVLLAPAQLDLYFVAAFGEVAYKEIYLANEDYLRAHCPPTMSSLYGNAGSALDILCALRCVTNSACSFFSVTGSQCSQWTFDLDPSYDRATFDTPTTPVYKPKTSVPAQLDVAIGKPVTAGSDHVSYASAPVLTYGTTCFSDDTYCYGSTVEGNWAVVDLLASYPVAKIVLTAPSLERINFFYDITIRAGSTGKSSDPKVGQTPSSATANQAFEYEVTGDIRYIRLQNEVKDKSILLCKVQALL